MTRALLVHGATTPNAPEPPQSRGFAVTLRHTTLGRTPLVEGSAQLRDLYLTTQTLTRDRHPPPSPPPGRDSSLQSQHARGRRTTLYTARLLGSAYNNNNQSINQSINQSVFINVQA
jgi:hypothetical protein